jgi:kynurenine formamidase
MAKRKTKKEEDSPFDLTRAINFTADWGDAFAHHGTTLNRYERGLLAPLGPETEQERMWTSFRVHLSPHSVTHMDLPWALARMSPDYASLAGQKLRMARYTTTLVFDAIVLDLRDKQRFLEGALASTPLGEFKPVRRLEPEEVRDLNTDLLITRRDILGALQGAENPTREHLALKERFVVLHTGWRERYAKGWHDLSNPAWEFLHPYLTHPYLNDETADWLVRCGIKGIGIDSSNMECPLYMLDPDLAPKYAEVQREYWRKTVSSNGLFEPVHGRILRSGTLLVESLAIYSRDLDPYYRGHLIRGKLWSFPLHIRNLPDSCLTSIIFEPERSDGPEQESA